MSKARDLANFSDVAPDIGRKNLIINGAMQVAQRGTSGSTSSTGYLSVDRFLVNANGTSVTQAQVADAPSGTGLEYSMSFTRTAAGQDFRHGVELPANGKAGVLDGELTISYYAKINSGTANGTLLYRYAASALGGGNTQTVTTSDSLTTTWQRFTHTFTNADIVASGDLSFSLIWSVDTNCTVYITGVQLEVGSVATPFEHRSYGEELALCQRYFWNIEGDPNVNCGYGTFRNSTFAFMGFQLPTAMRATPSMSTSGSVRIFNSGFYGGSPIATTLNGLYATDSNQYFVVTRWDGSGYPTDLRMTSLYLDPAVTISFDAEL